MKLVSWVECVACTKPIPGPRSHKRSWVKIYENSVVNFWLCEQDLKDTFVQEAQMAFGKALDQVVRLGAGPEILYPTMEAR